MDELTRLLLAARDGDQLALTAWIRRTQADVWRFCAHLVDAEEADDLTQDVYLRAHRALPGFRGDASARTWLLAIARRTCADAVRRRQRHRRLADALPSARPAADHSPTVELVDLLDQLAPKLRTPFVLTQVVGLSYAETAEVCDCAVGTVRSRIARARHRLLAHLPRHGHDDLDGHARA